MSPDQKTLWLKKFIAPADLDKFDEAFLAGREASYDRCRALFLNQYFPVYYQFRKSQVNLQYEDIASVQTFVQRKISTYESVEGLTPQQSAEKVFFELPLSLAQEFARTGRQLSKESLLEFVEFSEVVINAHFRQITEQTSRSSLADNHQSAVHADQQLMFGNEPDQQRQINFEDDRLFLDLATDEEEEVVNEEQSHSSNLEEVASLLPAASTTRRSRPSKRANVSSGVVLRKQAASKAKKSRAD